MRYLFRVLSAMVILHFGLAFSSIYLGNVGPDPFYGEDGNLLTPAASRTLAPQQQDARARGALSAIGPRVCAVTSVIDGLWGIITLTGYAVIADLPKDGAWNWIRTALGVIGLFLFLGLIATLLDLAQRMGRLGYALGIAAAGASLLGLGTGLNNLLNCAAL